MPILESEYSNQVFAAKENDNLAPRQVTGLIFEVEQGRVVLTWDDVITNEDDSAIEDLSGYRIYRKEQKSSSEEIIATVASDQTTYTDLTTKDGATYFYAIAAIDASNGNVGVKSAEITVRTIPSVPTGLVASSDTKAITLSWNSVKNENDLKLNENLSGYRIYRSESDSTGYQFIGSTASDKLTFIDDSVIQGTTYYYVITAYDLNE